MSEPKRNPCVICEYYMSGYECESDTCPVRLLKDENKRLRAENEKLKSDANWEWEKKIQEQNHRVYEMGEL